MIPRDIQHKMDDNDVMLKKKSNVPIVGLIKGLSYLP